MGKKGGKRGRAILIVAGNVPLLRFRFMGALFCLVYLGETGFFFALKTKEL
jgi:hypothetical protein